MSGALDVESLRGGTPGCTGVTHLNNAGAALPSRGTLDTVIQHLELEATIGGYEAAAAVSDRLDAARAAAARLLGAAPNEIAFTTSDTAAWTKAFWGFAFGGGFERRRRVLVDRGVYNSHHLAILQAAGHFALDIEVIGPGPDGPVDLDALGAALGPSAGLVTVTHVPTHSGAVAPVHEVGELARRAGVPYFLDACQSVGQLAVDVGAIGCDVATATGRKWLRGPRGTGLLFVRADVAERFDPPGIDASSASWSVAGDAYALPADARRFEEFEHSVAARLGLANAVDELLELGIDAVHTRISALAELLRDRLEQVRGVTCTDPGGRRSGVVTFTVDNVDAEHVTAAAAEDGINVSVSRAENSRLEFTARGLDTVVRAAPHVYNTIEELDRLVEVVVSVAGGGHPGRDPQA